MSKNLPLYKKIKLSLKDKIDSGEDVSIKEYMIEKASCVRSVKGGEKISKEELLALINQLGECKFPFTCPHGRPVFLKLVFCTKIMEKRTTGRAAFAFYLKILSWI